MFRLILLATATLLVGQLSMAQDTAATAPAGDQKLSALFKNLSGDPDKAAKQEMIRSDLLALKALTLSGRSALFAQHFGAKTTGPFNYVMQRLKKITLAKPTDSFAAWYVRESATIHFAPGYFQLDQARRVTMLIHEVTHAESVARTHETCANPYFLKFARVEGGPPVIEIPVPQLNGSALACDSRLDSAYAVGIIFAAGVANHCASCSREIREEYRDAGTFDIPHIADPFTASTLYRELLNPNGHTHNLITEALGL